MKTLVHLFLLPLTMLSAVNSVAQLSNAKTQTVKIYGNCGTCEQTIEKAGNQKKTVQLDWNKDAKTATVTWDSTRTNLDEVLQRVAMAGYDNEQFLAPDDVYAKLPGCCQYKRELKPVAVKNTHDGMDMSGNHQKHDTQGTDKTQAASSLQAVLNGYFTLKDALVRSDAAAAATAATALLRSVTAVDMNTLENQQHMAWMKVVKDIEAGVNRIAQTKDLAKQREGLSQLATPFLTLAKAAKLAEPVYYQHCPMYGSGKGAHWLSRENAVKNPYYGSQMMTCGSTIETITNK